MNNLIELTINQYNMVDYGDTVIVALSGGADSVCLLHNLVLLKDKYNLKVMACHLNHHLRGEESNSDMEFCKELCRQNNIELFVKEVDVDKLSNELKVSHEECGRNCRYEFFNSLAEKYNAKVKFIESGKGDGHAVYEAIKDEKDYKEVTCIWGDTYFSDSLIFQSKIDVDLLTVVCSNEISPYCYINVLVI